MLRRDELKRDIAAPVIQQTLTLQCREKQKLIDADCLNSPRDVMSKYEGTGIRSGKESLSVVLLWTTLTNPPDRVSTHDPSGSNQVIQMNTVSDLEATGCDRSVICCESMDPFLLDVTHCW